MPVRSKRQFRFFYAAHKRGEISDKELKEWTGGVHYGSLPEKIRKRATKMRSRKRR